jgi:hypothetical protein
MSWVPRGGIQAAVLVGAVSYSPGLLVVVVITYVLVIAAAAGVALGKVGTARRSAAMKILQLFVGADRRHNLSVK